MSERVGEQFGDYRLTRRLGGGTFGDVYLGVHVSKNSLGAVKVLQARLTNSEDLKDYINEIRSLFRLQHPNIVPLLDFGIERDIPFLIMAYAPNGTLRQPKGKRLPLDTVVAYIRQIAEALQHAHDLKLIHRDVKPDNILSGPNGQVWLSDFGIVSIAQSSRSLSTQDGAGTVPYMAPEQILGKPRVASDQYALGIIAFEWICGLRPFNGTAMEITMQHFQAQPPSLCEQVPMLASAIEEAVLRALAKDSKDRFASVREFAEALAASVGQSEPRSVLQKTEKQWAETVVVPMAQKTKEQWLSEGDAFYDAGKYKEAVEAYNYAIRLNPRYATAYYKRGMIYDDLKEYARAIEDYSRAIELNPRYAAAYNNRGFVYRVLEQYDKAIENYNRAIELNPRYAAAYNNRGIVYRKLEEYNKAIEDYSRVIELDPGDAMAYYNRGFVYEDLEEFDKAIEDYNHTIELDPRDTDAYFNRGLAYGELEEYASAIEDYNSVINLNPRDTDAYFNRGLAYYYLNDYLRAVQDFNYALELDPGNTQFESAREGAFRKLGWRM